MLKKWRESLQQDTVLFLPRNTTKGIFPPRPTYGSVMSACLSESQLFLFEFLHFYFFRYWLKTGHAPLMFRGHLLTHQCSCLSIMWLTSIANCGSLTQMAWIFLVISFISIFLEAAEISSLPVLLFFS